MDMHWRTLNKLTSQQEDNLHDSAQVSAPPTGEERVMQLKTLQKKELTKT